MGARRDLERRHQKSVAAIQRSVAPLLADFGYQNLRQRPWTGGTRGADCAIETILAAIRPRAGSQRRDRRVIAEVCKVRHWMSSRTACPPVRSWYKSRDLLSAAHGARAKREPDHRAKRAKGVRPLLAHGEGLLQRRA